MGTHPIGMKKVMGNNVLLRMIIRRTLTIGIRQKGGQKHLQAKKQVVVIVNGKDLMGNGDVGTKKGEKVEKNAVHIGMIGVGQEIMLILLGKLQG